MARKNIILIVITTMLISLIGINGVINAETISITGTSANDATITNSKGQDVTSQGNLNKWESYTVSYDWGIPNGTNIKAGDTVIFEVPDSIDVLATTSFPVRDSNGDVIGNFIINKGAHQGTLTFNDFYETHKYNDIHGTLSFRGNGNENQQVQNWEVNKNGWLDGNDIPTWVVVYNPNSKDLTNIQITDTLEGAQQYIPNSFQLQFGSVDENNQFTVENNISNPLQYIKIDGNKFTLNLDNIHQAVRIVYQTQPTVSGSLNLENVVGAKSDQLGISSVAASIQVSGSGNAGGDLNKPSSSSSSSSKPVVSSSSEVSSSASSSSKPVVNSSSEVSSSPSSSSKPVVSSSSEVSSSSSSSSKQVVNSSSEVSSSPSSSSKPVVSSSSEVSSSSSSSSKPIVSSSSEVSSSSSSSSKPVVNSSSEVSSSPSSSSKPVVSSNVTSVKENNNNNGNENTSHSSKLPQTGEDKVTSKILGFIGIIILVILSTIIYKKEHLK